MIYFLCFYIPLSLLSLLSSLTCQSEVVGGHRVVLVIVAVFELDAVLLLVAGESDHLSRLGGGGGGMGASSDCTCHLILYGSIVHVHGCNSILHNINHCLMRHDTVLCTADSW